MTAESDRLLDMTVRRMRAVARRDRKNAKRQRAWTGARALPEDLSAKQLREISCYGALAPEGPQ